MIDAILLAARGAFDIDFVAALDGYPMSALTGNGIPARSYVMIYFFYALFNFFTAHFGFSVKKLTMIFGFSFDHRQLDAHFDLRFNTSFMVWISFLIPFNWSIISFTPVISM